MLACLSCTPSFSSSEALISLNNCVDFAHLKQIHAKIIRSGISHDQLLVRQMIQISSSYGKLGHATLLFNQIENPSTFTWNLMIRSYTINGSSEKALLLYNLMICQGMPLDKFTFPFVIKACIESSSIHKGKEVYGLAVKCGFASDMFVQNTMMDLYFKCGVFDYAQKVFDKMRVRNVVSWTTMITGLISCGKLDDAKELFDQIPIRNVVSWSALINGYAKTHRTQEAFELFRRMQDEKVRPNEFTLVSLLKSCTELNSLKLGTRIHDYAIKNGFKIGVFLGTTLIDMYSKCGSLKDAKRVFNEMEMKSLATWNSMITSLGVHGCGEEAIDLFEEMIHTDINPDAITFVGALSACVNTNNVSKGHEYFELMIERYGIVPIQEHYDCIVELDRRAHILAEKCELVNVIPMEKQSENEAMMLLEDDAKEKNFNENSLELHC